MHDEGCREARKMDAYRLCFPEGWDGQRGMLLLVAVDGEMTQAAGGVPCRVVGSLTPGSPFSVPAVRTSPREQVTALLSGLGMPSRLRGYGYLRTALRLALEEPELLRGLNRRLYPAVAAEHGATAPAVERAIRHAVAVTWQRGGGERCRALLGRGCSCVGEVPSNGEFLTMLAECLLPGGM